LHSPIKFSEINNISARSHDKITIATTIAPFDIEKQKKAVQSWISLGFHVVSLNSKEEIESLSAHFPMISFYECNKTAIDICGKPLQFFDNFLHYFRDTDTKICAIVNSDVILRTDNTFLSFIRENVKDSFLFGSRLDVVDAHLEHGIMYKNGYDYFFFDQSLISCYPATDYALGAPWWDYWAVFCPLNCGHTVKQILSPIAIHIQHPMNYNMKLWFHYGSLFSEYVRNNTRIFVNEFSTIFQEGEQEGINALISNISIISNKLIHALSQKILIDIPAITPQTTDTYKVSAIVSLYNAEKYIAGCLENLINQTLYKKNQLEIIIINSNSPQNEEIIIQEYIEKYQHIRYIKTEQRETVYQAWNRGIAMAQGQYVTNANADDRHRIDGLEILSRALDCIPDIGIVYADSFVTSVENQTFDNCTPHLRYSLPDFNLGTQLSSSCFGAQPMWRKSVHTTIGLFSSEWSIAGDYDFFIHVAWKYKAAHIQETLGLFLSRNDSVSGYDNAQKTIQETLNILRKYRTNIPLEDLYPALLHDSTPLARMSALWDMGNLCALSPYRDYELALEFYQKAIDIDGLTQQEENAIQKGLANNAGVIAFCMNNFDQGLSLLQAALPSIEAQSNIELVKKSLEHGTRLYALHFRMTQFNHPVILQARMAKGIRLNECGNFEYSDDHQQVFWDGYIGMDGVPVTDEEILTAKKLLPRVSTFIPENTIPTPASKKKILMTMYGWNEEGGGTQLPRAIAFALAEQGYEVHVMYAAAYTDSSLPSYSVVRQKDGNISLYGIFNRATVFYDLQNPQREIADAKVQAIFQNLLDEISPDIIHFHNFLGLSLAIVATARNQSIPYIFTPHNYWTLCPRLYLLNKDGAQCSGPSSDGKKCAQCVDNSDEYSHYSSRLSHAITLFSDSGNRTIPPSHRTKQLLVEHGFTHDTITVIHQASPITEQLWHSVGKVRKNGNTSEKLSILYCGALLPIKGVHILAQAVQYLSPDAISVNIYGGGSQEYIRYLQSLDTNHILHFHGKYSLNDLPNILKQADIMVAPSLCEETGGLILTEALAARVPVIASAIGGYTDFIHNDSNGYLFTPGSSQELYNILQLLVSDRSKLHSLLQKMGAPRLFSDYINDITVLYSQLIQSHNNERKSSYTNIG